MADASQIIPWTALGLVGGWFATAITTWFKARASRYATDRSSDLKLEEHRDGLTFQLLEAARVELAELRVEVNRLRPLEHHLLQFEEALRHIEELLMAEGAEAQRVAKRNAKAFLTRVKRIREATGTIANEVQRVSSAVDLTALKVLGEPGSPPTIKPPSDG